MDCDWFDGYLSRCFGPQTVTFDESLSTVDQKCWLNELPASPRFQSSRMGFGFFLMLLSLLGSRCSRSGGVVSWLKALRRLANRNMNGTESTIDPLDGNRDSSIDLASLLERCRYDINSIDKLFGELESEGPHRSSVASPIVPAKHSEDRVASSQPAPDSTSNFAADAVRRLAADVEALGRVSSLKGVQEMLLEMQPQLVRCLRLRPGSTRFQTPNNS